MARRATTDQAAPKGLPSKSGWTSAEQRLMSSLRKVEKSLGIFGKKFRDTPRYIAQGAGGKGVRVAPPAQSKVLGTT